ncbi:MAG: LptF/LptG family permease [Elusimicrobiota bacterium]
MKIIKRYVLWSFLRPFTSGLIAFIMLMAITHFFDYLHKFLENKTSFSLLATYFLYRIPEWFVTITPVATLLAILFSLGTLNRNHEITAVKSSGIKLIYIIRPLVLFSILMSIVTGLTYETVVPHTNAKAEELFFIIRGKDPRKADPSRTNFTYMGSENTMFRIRQFQNNSISGLTIIEFHPGSLIEKNRLTAKRADYVAGTTWKLSEVRIRDFNKDAEGDMDYRELDEKTMDLGEKPVNFSKPVKSPEQMDFLTLFKYIERLKNSGFSTVKERVLLHYKISFPFSNTIILILGIPIALWGGLRSRVTGFFISIVICFIYWGTISVGRALGASAILSPMLGAWAANLIFLMISIMMMKVARII